MRSLRVTVPDELAQKIDTERDLLGFESTEEYLRWILERRTSIETGSDRDQLLSAYADRVEELEAKLDGDGERRDDRSAEGDDTADAASEAGADADTGADPDTATESEGGRIRASGETDDMEYNLSPGTARIADDSVNELASDLAGVEGQRLDAFVREAVAQTGEQLDGSPESGVDYRSHTTVGAGDGRPGEEITDLDELELPGYDEELLARRRVAVGAALAFLRDREEAMRSDFVEELYESYPAGYETADSWWGCVKRGLEQVDRVMPAGENSRKWEFRKTPGRVTRLPSRG